jgi:hypothetical protein
VPAQYLQRRIFGDSLAAGSNRPSAPELGSTQVDEEGSMDEGEVKIFLGSGYTQCKADRRSITSTLVNTKSKLMRKVKT